MGILGGDNQVCLMALINQFSQIGTDFPHIVLDYVASALRSDR